MAMVRLLLVAMKIPINEQFLFLLIINAHFFDDVFPENSSCCCCSSSALILCIFNICIKLYTTHIHTQAKEISVEKMNLRERQFTIDHRNESFELMQEEYIELFDIEIVFLIHSMVLMNVVWHSHA